MEQEFEVTEEHLKLIKELNWELRGNGCTYYDRVISTDIKRPFGNSNWEEDVLEAIGEEKNPEYDEYSRTQLNKAELLFDELATAIDICCFFLEFKVGKFTKRKSWLDWERV